MVYSKKRGFSKKRKTIRRRMKGGGRNDRRLRNAIKDGDLDTVNSAIDDGVVPTTLLREKELAEG